MDLSIIIVNWNAGGLLRRCLDALPSAVRRDLGPGTQNSEFKYEVFVIDNASRDNSITLAKQSAQPFELIPLPQNTGFARANNSALKKARGTICLLLNPDTEAKPGSLAALVDAFTAHPSAGVIGGKFLNPDGSVQPSVRRLPTPLVLAALLSRIPRITKRVAAIRAYDMSGFSYSEEARVEQVMGACFAIPREVLQALGPLDERFWMWFEEVDYCARVLDAGWEVWFTPSVAVTHHRATSFSQVSALRRTAWFSVSVLRYSRKHFGWITTLGLAALVPWALLTGLVATVAHRPPGVRKQA